MNALLQDLNHQQREAVTHADGPLLIIAGPGSGKTRVIVHRIAYLVQDMGINPYRIMAVTFTNRAAREMKERLQQLMGPRALDLTLGTFHATCARMLRREGEHIGLDRNFSIYDDTDQLALIKQVLEDLEVDPKRYNPRAVLSVISNAKSQLLTPGGFRPRVQTYFEEIALRAYERYQELLARGNAVDFDDLLLRTYLLFLEQPAVLERWQERYLQLMVDEFQDTNIAQYAIARQVAGKHQNIAVVGDPDQSIYAWRNADIRNILNFQRDYPDARQVTLEENYRSTKTVLDAASGVIAANTQRIDKRLTTTNAPGSPVVIMEAYDEEEEAQKTLQELEGLMRSGRYTYRDCAIMYRTNAQSRPLEEACLRLGVPYQLVGGVRFYQRREVKDLLAYLRVITNPTDDVSLARVINTPPRGIGQKTLDGLRQFAAGRGLALYEALGHLAAEDGTPREAGWSPRGVKALRGFYHLLEGLREASREAHVSELVQRAFEQTGMRIYLEEDVQHSEERLENVKELLNVAGEFDGLPPTEGLAAFLERSALVSDVDQMEEEQQALTLITLHQAKGLEYPVVCIVGMEEGLLPHVRSLDNPTQLEEERRLCYVGMTRAKDLLYLSRAFRRGFGGRGEPREPSRFLGDLPPHLVASPQRRTKSRPRSRK